MGSEMCIRDSDKIIDIIRNQKLNEMMGAGAVSGPTNNVGSGNIAGTADAGDDPPGIPASKKKKRYIYGGRGSRKMWMT